MQTSMSGSQVTLDGAIVGAPAAVGDILYAPTKNYSLYAVQVGASSMQVVAEAHTLGLAVAPTAIDGQGQVCFVSLNGVYVFSRQ